MSRFGLTARSAGKLPALAGAFAFLIAVAGGGVGVHAAQTAQQAPAVDGLPDVATIIAHYVEAAGGEELLRSITSSHATGSLSIASQGMTGELEVFAAAPNKLLVRTTIAGMGDSVTGFNGEIGWSVDSMMGPRLLQGKELDQIRDQADFYSDLYDPATFSVMEVLGMEEFGGTSCYTVRLIRLSGTESYQFFEVDSGLIRGVRNTQESIMGSIAVTTSLSEYREFGGPLVPTLMVQDFGVGQTAEITLQSVEYNSVLTETFDLPVEISALVGG
jgi:zinc protease